MSRRNEQLLFLPNSAGRVAVCLAYPNSYEVAMANLGFQAVFRILATTPGVVCERLFFDPQAKSSRSFESGRPAGDFDLLAFSLSFESDYPNIVRILDRAGIPSRACERRSSRRPWPLLLAGGPATFLNPEPVAPLFDVFLIGEGEEMIPEAFAGVVRAMDHGREAIIERLSRIEGAYVPERYEPKYGEDAKLAGYGTTAPAPARVKRRYVANLDHAPVSSCVVAPEAVFGDYYLVEASRGCEWGCRFCAAGFMYRPVRHRSSEALCRDAVGGLSVAATIGLVGAEIASHPGVAGICEKVAAAGGRVSPSSLKADVITPRLAAAIAAGGTRSVTVAPEAGSERMRRVINKNLDEDAVLRAADLMVGHGVESLKLYFMCALPTETMEDVDAIYELTAKIRTTILGHGRARGRVGRIRVAVNPFVPKPWTPFQWDGMLPVAEMQRRVARLRKRFASLPGVEMESESPRAAYLQTLFSRGDRRVVAVIEALAREDGGWWQQLQAMRRGEHAGVRVSPDEFVLRSYDEREPFPWEIVDHRIARAYLWKERCRALAGIETAPCDVSTCRTCGAC